MGLTFNPFTGNLDYTAPPQERSQPRTAHEPRGFDARGAVFERAYIV